MEVKRIGEGRDTKYTFAPVKPFLFFTYFLFCIPGLRTTALTLYDILQ